jgi:hypothetical protein
MIAWLALVLLDVLGGALSLLPYPAILTANIMSMAGDGPRGWRRFRFAIPYALLSLYPLAWLLLYRLSWDAMSRGDTSMAFQLSGVPAVLSAIGAAGWYLSERPQQKRYAAKAAEVKAAVEPQNPLIWTLLCAGGPRILPGAPRVTVEAALAAIRAACSVNQPATGYGTPLKVAVHNLWFEIDGSPHDRHQKDLCLLVRALLARGADFSKEERKDIWNHWLLRLAMFEGPVTTRTENPLVWRIVKFPFDGEDFPLVPEDAPLLNRPTRLHGTPLFLALLRSGSQMNLPKVLVERGARLSDEEQQNPAAMASLERLFRQFPKLCGVYSP